jgi:hypothetical protein
MGGEDATIIIVRGKQKTATDKFFNLNQYMYDIHTQSRRLDLPTLRAV